MESPETRRRTMQAVKAKDTTPEMHIRRILHALGYRYRLHVKTLPGTPDLVFRSRRKIIFVHGCFWHGHDCRRGARIPKTNIQYWKEKISRNRQRDARVLDTLRELGWSVFTVWECQLAATSPGTLRTFLDSAAP